MIDFMIYEDDRESALHIKELIESVYKKEHNTKIRLVCGDKYKIDGRGDIIIMDIELDKLNGIELAKKIQEENPNSAVIFVSGYSGYFEDVYEVKHIYFLQKPIKEDRFKAAIKMAENAVRNIQKEVFIDTKSGMIKVKLENVIYFESSARNVHIVSEKNNTELKGEKLDDILKFINDERFVRCHQSFAVNIEKFKDLSKYKLRMERDYIIPVSRKYIQNVKNKISASLAEL